MEQVDKTHFSHQSERPLRVRGTDSHCDFHLPSEPCPTSKFGKAVTLEDRVTAPIWCAWIAGIANIEK